MTNGGTKKQSETGTSKENMVFKINCGLQNKLWITSSIPVTAEKCIGVVFILSFKFFNTV